MWFGTFASRTYWATEVVTWADQGALSGAPYLFVAPLVPNEVIYALLSASCSGSGQFRAGELAIYFVNARGLLPDAETAIMQALYTSRLGSAEERTWSLYPPVQTQFINLVMMNRAVWSTAWHDRSALPCTKRCLDA